MEDATFASLLARYPKMSTSPIICPNTANTNAKSEIDLTYPRRLFAFSGLLFAFLNAEMPAVVDKPKMSRNSKVRMLINTIPPSIKNCLIIF